MREKQWYAVDVWPSRENHEAIEYGLMEAGALGTETVDQASQILVTGYFENSIDEDHVRRALVDACHLHNQPLSKVDQIDFKVRAVADRDWLAEWKKSWQPTIVGRFIIAPPWLGSEPDSSDAIIIRINPGMAFGTGTHETTRLCLRAIDDHYRGGSFLDVGTGTGVLAIAAAKLQQPDREGERVSIQACDTDPDAIQIARENAELNDVDDVIDFRVGSVNDATLSADFVCANLTAPVIVDLLPALIGATCGRLVLSGILDSQEQLVTAGLADLGIADYEIDRDGEWIAIVI